MSNQDEPSPFPDVMREYAFKTVEEAAAHTIAEHVAIAAKIADWRNLNRRIEFLSMIAERITFLSVLKNEGVTLRLVDGDKFVSEPKVLPAEIRDWIVKHRPEITRELKEKRT